MNAQHGMRKTRPAAAGSALASLATATGVTRHFIISADRQTSKGALQHTAWKKAITRTAKIAIGLAIGNAFSLTGFSSRTSPGPGRSPILNELGASCVRLSTGSKLWGIAT
jgi:hypothetical protein